MMRVIAELEACDPSRNILRSWQVAVGRDLFGQWVAIRAWGRIGHAGQSQQVAVAGPREAMRLARRWLRHRASAPRRIGVVYRPRGELAAQTVKNYTSQSTR